ncbi:MAG TPA: LytTR family DNA-binding domain-containing protein [Calditrichia bacterium]|nr:LytTR family DNA-binding domain-containing protein [Calditrichia bacterium]
MSDQTLRVLIVDDEHLAREMIKIYLRDFPDFELVGEFDNALAALDAVEEMRPDLIFLDIQMPVMDGFEFLRHLDQPPVILFSTAYDQFALKAFDASAADYLLKPYDRERFARALERARMLLGSRGAHLENLERLKRETAPAREFARRLAVKEGNRTRLIPVAAILYAEAQADYLKIHTQKERYLIHHRMKNLEEQLDPGDFVRIHRSYLVNIKGIRAVERSGKESLQVEMIDGAFLPVSREGWRRLKQLIGE